MSKSIEEDSNLRFLCRELASALDAVVNLREELRLAEGLPPGRVLYVDRLFREGEEALKRARKAGVIRGPGND